MIKKAWIQKDPLDSYCVILPSPPAQLVFFFHHLTFVNYVIVMFTDLIKGLEDIGLGGTLDSLACRGFSE